MTDEEFLCAVEMCELPPVDFSHEAHVRVAYLCLRDADFADALARIRRLLRAYVAHLGKADRYHETITVACAALIQQAMCERGDGGAWPAFARENSELLRSDLLSRFYAQAQLNSPIARRIFVLPTCPSAA